MANISVLLNELSHAIGNQEHYHEIGDSEWEYAEEREEGLAKLRHQLYPHVLREWEAEIQAQKDSARGWYNRSSEAQQQVQQIAHQLNTLIVEDAAQVQQAAALLNGYRSGWGDEFALYHAVRAWPRDGDAWGRLIRWRVDKGEAQQAVAAARQAMQSAPRQVVRSHLLAALEQAQQWDVLVSFLDDELRHTPDDSLRAIRARAATGKEAADARRRAEEERQRKEAERWRQEELSRQAEREAAERQRREQEQKERERREAEEAQRRQWRAEKRCEVCGANLGFWDRFHNRMRCHQHTTKPERQYKPREIRLPTNTLLYGALFGVYVGGINILYFSAGTPGTMCNVLALNVVFGGLWGMILSLLKRDFGCGRIGITLVTGLHGALVGISSLVFAQLVGGSLFLMAVLTSTALALLGRYAFARYF